MSFATIVMLVVSVSFVIACIDRCIGNKLGLAAELERGFSFMGPIALSIVGMICLSPILASFLQPIVVPIYQFFGADPAMFAPTFLSADSGGYAISSQISDNPELIRFAGLIVGCLVGPIITFVIPVGFGMIKDEDKNYFAAGIMPAFIAAPFGCFVGALASGLTVKTAIVNLVPVFIISIAIAIIFTLFPKGAIKGFNIFATFVSIMITVGLAIGAFQSLTGFVIVKNLGDMSSGFNTAGIVTLIIAGSFPIISLIEKVFPGPLQAISNKMGITQISLSNIIISAVTSLPAFAEYDKLDNKGKVLVSAFAGSGAFIIGPHLGFVSATDKTMIMPLFAAKISAAVIAMVLASIYAKKIFKDI